MYDFQSQFHPAKQKLSSNIRVASQKSWRVDLKRYEGLRFGHSFCDFLHLKKCKIAENAKLTNKLMSTPPSYR